MINQVMGFFSSQRQQLKGWELPLTGLLLTAGLAVSVATVKTTASQHKEHAINTISAPSTLETVQTQPQELAVESSPIPSPVTAAEPQEQQQQQAVDSLTVPSPVTAAEPQEQQQQQSVDFPMIPPSAIATLPQPQKVQKRAIHHTRAIPPTVKTVPQPQEQQQQQQQAIDPSIVPSTVTAAEPQSPEQAVDPIAVAKPSIKWNRKAQEASKPKSPIAQAPKADASLEDGTYLYGQSSQAGQIGKEYVVFQARQGKVVGAMYMPSSEYACFYGTLNSKQMNLTVVNPYNQTAFVHTIARAQPTQIAAVGGQINLENTYDSLTYPHSIGLEGYLPVDQVGDNDKQILSTCVSNYQAKAWNP